MQDIPIFTTENGVASLTLREIPYTKKAYIRVQSSETPNEFLRECKSFCVMVGAEYIYASGCEACEAYPLHTSVVQMQCLRKALPESDLSCFPVTENTIDTWLEVYNQKAGQIANAAYLSKTDSYKVLNEGAAYFVHKLGQLKGIGWVDGNKILWIASCSAGAGKQVLCALAGTISGESVALEVATTNEKAINMYEALGFVKTAELSRWYQL